MVPDPYDWVASRPDMTGRIVSTLLPWGHTSVLPVAVRRDCDSRRRRALMANAVARRVAQSDLPCLVFGDFNCEPGSDELTHLDAVMRGYTHVAAGTATHITGHTRHIDLHFIGAWRWWGTRSWRG